MIDGGRSLHWVFEQTIGSQNNSGSPFQAWTGLFLCFTCKLHCLNSFITLIKTLMLFSYQIYSAGVSVFLGGNKPSRVGNARGDISVNFSCDPDVALALVCVFTSWSLKTVVDIFHLSYEKYMTFLSGWSCFGWDITSSRRRTFRRRYLYSTRDWTTGPRKWTTGD